MLQEARAAMFTVIGVIALDTNYVKTGTASAKKSAAIRSAVLACRHEDLLCSSKMAFRLLMRSSKAGAYAECSSTALPRRSPVGDVG